MILLYAIAGLFLGSFFNWAADYVPQFASKAITKSSPRLAPAVWHLLTSFTFRASSMRLPPSFRLSIAVELTAALLFAYLGQCFGPSWKLLYLAIVCSFFLLVAIIDLKYRLVLNVLVYPAMAVTLLFHSMPPGWDTLITLLGGMFGLAPFLLMAWLRPGELGAGDVKLAALIGLVVGFPLVVYALIVAVLAGGITTLVLLLTRRWNLESHIPYAPFLCLGAIFSLVYATFLLSFLP
jgi:prepilin signal peptidase PulO-like enzyme (type II secretory pathway)